MIALLVLAVAYLLGAIPFGYLLVKWKTGGDVRSSGSGNIGATNVLRTTGKVAGVATLLYLIAAVPLATAISRRYVRGWNLLYILFVIALFLPVALIPQFQLILNLHLYNTQPGYILLFLANPIGILILVAFIRSIPRELDEAVAIDGCGYIRYVWRIIVPLTKPAIATVAILHAIGIWNELVLPTIYLTREAYYPMTRGLIVFTGIYGNDWPLLAAAVLILALPMVVLFLFLQRYIIGGFTSGSLRG